MKNPIISSMLIVFGFWWVVAAATGLWYNGIPEKADLLASLERSLYVAVGVGALVFLFVHLRNWILQGYLLPSVLRGIQCSIGQLPGAMKWPRNPGKLSVDEKRWPLTHAWIRTASPEYRAAFEAILQVIAGTPVPASPVAGGHGGLMLFEHTLNVVETGLGRQKDWSFTRRSRDPLHGATIPDEDIPLAVLILAAHDIGKIIAFVVEKGRVIEKKPSHDKEGSRILATMDEVWRLPEDDRKTLIVVVAHEHHPQDFPQHAGDRARLLLEFLIETDAEASRAEEGKTRETRETTASPEAAKTPDAADQEEKEIEAIWTWFTDYIVKPGTINGNNKEFRVGFKAGARLYLNEVQVRRAFAEGFFQDKSAAEDKMGDGRSRIMETFLYVMEKKGVLLKDFNNLHFSYKNALFKLTSHAPDGRILGRWEAAIVLDMDDSFPSAIRKMKDAPNPPTITGVVFPQRALRATDETKMGNTAQDVSEKTDNFVQENKGPPNETTVIETVAPAADAPLISLAGVGIEASDWGDKTEEPVTLTEEKNDPPAPEKLEENIRIAPQSIEDKGDFGGASLDTPPDSGKKKKEGNRLDEWGFDPEKVNIHLNMAPVPPAREAPAPVADTPPERPSSRAEKRAGRLSKSFAHGIVKQEKASIISAGLENPDSATSNSYNPVPPSGMGGLGKAIFMGMVKQGRPPAQTETAIDLSIEEACGFASKGGVNVRPEGFDAFWQAVKSNPKIVYGLTLMEAEQGRKICIQLKDDPT